MGRGSKEQKRVYIRALSSNLHRWTPKTSEVDYVNDDPIVHLDGLGLSVLMILGRNRQRLLSQAWAYWTQNSNVCHDYSPDVITILSREIAIGEQRTELEVEILHKWALQNGGKDATGLAAAVVQSSSRQAIVDVFQQCRLEVYHPGDVVLFQGQLPQVEDGHFSVLQGSCDVINLHEGSVSAIRLLECARWSRFEAARQLLNHSQPLASMQAPSGFGELSCMTGVKRHATIRAGAQGASFVVVPQQCMLRLLESRRQGHEGIAGSSPSEAIELFRQFGLASKISPADLARAANHMVKRTVELGDCLYFKNQPCSSIFLIVSGDFVLDTGNPVGIETAGKKPQEYAFLSSIQEFCFHMSSGGILGDEGAIGREGESKYDSTVAVASETGVIFEAQGFARSFLAERIRAMRYTALTYKELPRWSLPIPYAELSNIYGSLNSLRKCIAHSRPLRGTVEKPYSLPTDTVPTFTTPLVEKRRAEAAELEKHLAAREARIALKAKTNLPARGHNLSASASLGGVEEQKNKSFSKVNGLGLLFLKHINVTCKRHASERLKLHARENILTDSLIHTAAAAAAKSTPEMSLAGPRMGTKAKMLESRLQRGLDAYHERNRANDVYEEEEEGPRVTLAAASNMLGMLASAAASAIKPTMSSSTRKGADGTKAPDEEMAVADAEQVDSAESGEETNPDSGNPQGSLAGDGESQKSETEAEAETETDAQSVATRLSHVSSHDSQWFQRTREILARPRIQQYFLYLERSRAQKGTSQAAAAVTMSLNDQEDADDHGLADGAGALLPEENKPGATSSSSPSRLNLASPEKAQVYWRPPSPSAIRPEDPIVAEPKSRPSAAKTRPELIDKQPLWPKREWGSKPTEGVLDAAAPRLSSLLFNPKTYLQRIRQVESSGYGQLKVAATHASRAKEALLESFERTTHPNTRRIALLDWQCVQQTQHIQLTSAKTKGAKAQGAADGGDKVQGDEKEKEEDVRSSAAEDFLPPPVSFDLGDPAQFLKLLYDKDFAVRSQHKPKNVWRTRTMKVTHNATEVQENGSVWFRRKMAALGLQEADLKASPARRFQRKGLRAEGGSPESSHSTRLETEHKGERQMEPREERKDDEELKAELEELEEHDEQEELEEQEELDKQGGQELSEQGPPNGDSLDTWGENADSVGDASQAKAVGENEAQVPAPKQRPPEPVPTSPTRGVSRGTIRVAALAVPEPSTLKEPSKALRAFREVLEGQCASRRHLDGRKRHDSSSKFQLDPPAFVAVDDNKEARRAQEVANRAAEENLLEALLPPGVAHPRPFGKFKPIKAGKTTGTASPSSPSLVASSSSSDAAELGNRELQEWQHFTVGCSLEQKHGPSASLPVLAGVSTDPAEPRRKKSSLNFANRLAKLPGSEESRPTEPESYLLVFQRQFDKSKKKAKSRLY